MTKEEAIKILKAIRVYECYPKSASEETKEAIDMAIEALSADTVSRKDTVTLNSPISIQAEMVAVVRCKDCRYCANYTDGHRECRLLKNLKTVPCTYVLVDGDDYCSHGERREEVNGFKSVGQAWNTSQERREP